MNAQLKPESEPKEAKAPPALIENISRKADGSFVAVCNGYPFHATEAETPDIHEQILGMLEAGEPYSDYVEPAPLPDQRDKEERYWRDTQIEGLRWLRERHRDQQELQVVTTLNEDEFNSLLTYLQQLRDWPQSELFPDSEQRPNAPSWVADDLN